MIAVQVFCWLSLLLVVGKVLRVAMPPLQKLYLPSSVIGGIVGLVVIQLFPDLIDRGIMLAGGGALLRGLKELIAEEMDLPVNVAEDPLKAVANGTGVVLQEMDAMSRSFTPS